MARWQISVANAAKHALEEKNAEHCLDYALLEKNSEYLLNPHIIFEQSSKITSNYQLMVAMLQAENFGVYRILAASRESRQYSRCEINL